MQNVSCEILTRGYELDKDALIPPATFFRYMEHLRWESAEAGTMDLMELLSRGYLLVVAGQQLQMYRHIGMGVRLQASMRVGRAGRSSLTLVERFEAEDGPVAQGQVAAVLLDPGGAPAELPDELRALAAIDEVPPLCSRLEEARPDAAWSWKSTVRSGDLDLYRHANQASFLEYVEDARLMGVEKGGLPKEAGGRLMAVALDYMKQLFMGDEIETAVWVLEDGAVGVETIRGDEVVSRGRVEAPPSPPSPPS